MRNWRIRPPDREDAGQPFETANDRFHRRYRYLTASSLLIATTAHFGVFALNPRMVVPATEPAGERIVALTLPPEVRIPPPPQSIETGARFSAIEGGVQVKRAGTLEWIDATAAVVLHRNDLVRTGSGATAEILFADGTQFSVRPDSLITSNG